MRGDHLDGALASSATSESSLSAAFPLMPTPTVSGAEGYAPVTRISHPSPVEPVPRTSPSPIPPRAARIAAVLGALAAVIMSRPLEAQSSGQPPDRLTVQLSADGTACSPILREIGLVVVDGAGRPVVGAEVEVLRGTARRPLGDSLTTDRRGAVTVLRDGQLPDLAAEGEAFTVRVRRPRGAWATAVVTIGYEDASRCHIARLDGPVRMVLR